MFIQFLFVAIIVANTANALNTIAETEKNIMKEQLAKCLKAEGVSDGQLDGYFAGRDLQNDNAKCLASCAMEQFTVVEKQNDGTYMINTANVANIAGMVTDDEKKIKSINEMAETCKANVASQERCQYASDLIICLVGEANYHGRLD